jgi:hypothetical protein
MPEVRIEFTPKAAHWAWFYRILLPGWWRLLAAVGLIAIPWGTLFLYHGAVTYGLLHIVFGVAFLCCRAATIRYTISKQPAYTLMPWQVVLSPAGIEVTTDQVRLWYDASTVTRRIVDDRGLLLIARWHLLAMVPRYTASPDQYQRALEVTAAMPVAGTRTSGLRKQQSTADLRSPAA